MNVQPIRTTNRVNIRWYFVYALILVAVSGLVISSFSTGSSAAHGARGRNAGTADVTAVAHRKMGDATATPTLGIYADTGVGLSASTVITPSAAPTDTTGLNVSTSTSFQGTLTASPTTGEIRVTDAHPAGTFTVTVKAFGAGSATKTFTLTVTNGTACAGTIGFTNAADVHAGSPVGIAIGDFNNDGKQDLATANFGSSTISIRLGDGLGGFSGTTEINVGTNPSAIAVGDFNNDGKPDLVTANQNGNSVSIRLGDGLGGFGGTTDLSVGAGPRAIVVGDFNNDGKQDFATANGGQTMNNVSIRLGDGAGGFSAVIDVSVGTTPTFIAVGDFNNDGKADLAVANYQSSTVSIRLGDGLGGFTNAPDVNGGFIVNPLSVAIGDFNNDGKQDLAIADQGTGSIEIRLGNGAGGFSGNTAVPVNGNPVAVAIGDFNNDGKQDLVALQGNGASIRLGDGLGGFSGTLEVPRSLGTASAIAIGDFNNDGKQDYATANQSGGDSISVLLGRCIPPSPTLSFDGRLRDRVSRNDGAAGLSIDGDPDGTFTMTLPPSTFSSLITKIVLSGPNGDVWDTIPNNALWTVGVARSLDGSFENPDGFLNNVPVGNTGIFKLFVSAALPDVFTQGSIFTVTVTFSDNSTATGNVTVTKTAAVDLSIVNLSASTNPSSSPTAATEGQRIDYTIRVKNNGTELANGITLTHQFASYEVYDIAGGGVNNSGGAFGSCTPDDVKVLCTIGNLGPGEDATIDINVYFRKASDPSAGHAAFTIASVQTDANASDNTGQITVPLGTLPRPDNDDLAHAITLPSTDNGPSGGIAGSNLGATRQSDLNLCSVTACIGIQNQHQPEPIHAGQFGDSSIWYTWTAPSDGPIDFFTTTSKFNTLLAVYSFENGYFTEVASNDDAGPGVTWSKVHFDAVAHKTYSIAVDGFLGAAGDVLLDWRHSPSLPATLQGAITGICGGAHPDCDGKNYPAVVCTSDSDQAALCQSQKDAGGFTLITIKGINFTSNTRIIIRGDILKGFLDKDGTQSINGATDFINSQTLVAHIPPYPQLTLADLATTQVLTFLSSAAAVNARGAATIQAIPPGLYSLGANTALLNVIQLKTVVLLPGQLNTVCGNIPGLNKLGEETCLSFITGDKAATMTPTWFAINAYCDVQNPNNAFERAQCLELGDDQASFEPTDAQWLCHQSPASHSKRHHYSSPEISNSHRCRSRALGGHLNCYRRR